MSCYVYTLTVLPLLILFLSMELLYANPNLEEYVKTNPKDLKAVYSLASSHAKGGNHKKALKYWRHLAIQRKSPKAMYWYARGLYLAETGHEALRICDRINDPTYKTKCSKIQNKIQEEFPEQLQLYQSNRLIKKGEYETAMDTIESLLEEDDTNPHYRLAMGRIFHGLKKFDYAYDHYIFATSKINSEFANKALKKLKLVGRKALKFVKDNKASIDDSQKFYYRVYLAFKLATEDSEDSFKGLKMRAIEFYRMQNQQEESFNNYYRMAFLNSLQGDKEEAKANYNSALDNAEDLMYPLVEFLLEELEKQKNRTEYVLDIMNEVGGEEIYRRLQQAAIAEDKSNQSQIAKAANTSMKKLGVSQAQFVAEYENYKRKIDNASSNDAKKELLDEFKAKYKHIFNDPAMKKRLESFMKSGEASKLKEKYGQQYKQFR